MVLIWIWTVRLAFVRGIMQAARVSRDFVEGEEVRSSQGQRESLCRVVALTPVLTGKA